MGTLAYLILCDQLARNMHRGKAEAFATDARALEAERLVNDSPAYAVKQEKKNEVISDKPDYDIDERVRMNPLQCNGHGETGAFGREPHLRHITPDVIIRSRWGFEELRGVVEPGTEHAHERLLRHDASRILPTVLQQQQSIVN